MQASTYVQSSTYFHAIDLLEAIVKSFDPTAPDMARSDIIQVLGEELDVWPVSVLNGQDEGKVLVAA